jgi:hypothetical protein
MLAYLGTAETFLSFAPGDPDAGVTIPAPLHTHTQWSVFSKMVQEQKIFNF